MKSNLRNNLDSIKNDVSNLFKKIGDPNDKILQRTINPDIQLNGYTDRFGLYENKTQNTSHTSQRVGRDNDLIQKQNEYLGDSNKDARLGAQSLYPNSGIKEYGNLRDAVIENQNDGELFLNASLRSNLYQANQLLHSKSSSKKLEKFKTTDTEESKNKDPRDQRFNLYPNSQIVEFESERNKQVENPTKQPNQPFENSSQRKSSLKKQTGDVFAHNADRDRVPINPSSNYRSSDYVSTSLNQLDAEITYDKNKQSINDSKINFPTGDVFSHNAHRDRVPIDPKNLYRSADYVSTEYNQLDLEVDNVPAKARINSTTNMMLNREFNLVNDNKTSKDEQNETTMIHTPYTPLDKFDKPNILFKNVNDKKTQVDVLNEFIVNIDSSDRNITYYPNPFKLRVLFNASSDASADLKILRSFENIKYFRLETATLPRYYTLKLLDVSTTTAITDTNERTIIDAVRLRIHTTKDATSAAFMAYIVGYTPPTNYQVQYVAYTYTSNTNINAKISIINPSNVSIAYELQYVGANDSTFTTSRYIVDTTKDLSKDRYLMINLDEITDNTQNSTSGRNQYNYLYPDYITDNYFYGDNHFVDKIFKNAKLGMVQNLTITMSDSFGNLIQGGKYMDIVDSTKDTASTTDTITSTTVYNDSLTYIRHPYYRNFQLTLMFKVGCYETEIDKKIFY
jgi:hypothetical protein